jgi:hypothetical protein
MEQKQLCYKVEQNGEIHYYSGIFKSIDLAFLWYMTHGKWLEAQCNRKLILSIV